MTGGWGSPLIFTLLTAVTVAGLARGVAFSIRIAVVTVLAVSVPVMQATTDKRTALLQCATWGGVIVLVAIIAGVSRRVSGEADRERELFADGQHVRQCVAAGVALSVTNAEPDGIV